MSWLKRVLTVDSRVLLAFYACIPLTLATILADNLFFNHALRDFLPRRPEDYVWCLVIFNLPHIMASFVTYADREYLVAYKKPLFKGSLIVVALTAFFVIVFDAERFFVFLAYYTLYHVVMQQYGIALMLLKRPPNIFFHFWKWLSIAGGGLLYVHVYKPYIFRLFTDIDLGMVGAVLLLLSAPFGLIFFFQIARSNDITLTSKLFFFSTFLILITSGVCFAFGYPFLAVLVPRFIHDATAFTVYAVHDHNRNLVKPHNVIYRALKPLHLSPMFLCLPLGIAIAWQITMNQHKSIIIMAVLVYFTLLHYYMEAYMWRRGMPHRQNVGFRIA